MRKERVKSPAAGSAFSEAETRWGGYNPSMPSMIGVSDIWKMFEWTYRNLSGSRKERKTAIVQWLDEVNRNLTILSDTWLSICNGVEGSEFQSPGEALRKSGIENVLGGQSIAAGVLKKFYESATAVMGGRVELKFHTDFNNALGTLLYERDIARTIIDSQERIVALDSRNTRADALKDVRTAADSLQREVIALRVLITNFKAQE